MFYDFLDDVATFSTSDVMNTYSIKKNGSNIAHIGKILTHFAFFFGESSPVLFFN